MSLPMMKSGYEPGVTLISGISSSKDGWSVIRDFLRTPLKGRMVWSIPSNVLLEDASWIGRPTNYARPADAIVVADPVSIRALILVPFRMTGIV